MAMSVERLLLASSALQRSLLLLPVSCLFPINLNENLMGTRGDICRHNGRLHHQHAQA